MIASVPEHYLPKLPPAKKGRWTLACRTESVAPPGLREMPPRTFLICAALATAGSAMTSGCAVETTLPLALDSVTLGDVWPVTEQRFRPDIAQREITTALESALDARRQRITISRSQVNSGRCDRPTG
jgi:hypothetical protein